jgi:hypothetical protein
LHHVSEHFSSEMATEIASWIRDHPQAVNHTSSYRGVTMRNNRISKLHLQVSNHPRRSQSIITKYSIHNLDPIRPWNRFSQDADDFSQAYGCKACPRILPWCPPGDSNPHVVSNCGF